MDRKKPPLKVKKVLNNNAVVAHDGEREKIVMGSGIGFNCKKNDIIPSDQIEKIFVMQEENERFQELLRTVPEEHIAIAENIISYTEETLSVSLNEHIHIALTDHLSFALERLKRGIDIQNKLLNEIKVLYKKEYEVGLWAKTLIKEKLGVTIPDDEAGHIALHIHTAKMSSNNMEKALQQATMITEMMDLIQDQFNTEIDKESYAYQRLITHLQFAFARVENGELFHTMDKEMLSLIKDKYKRELDCASKMAALAKEEYHFEFPESEIGYISLHIQRIIENLKPKAVDG